MGRIKQTFIKRTGRTLIESHPKRFKEDFEHNKKVLEEIIASGELDCPSKMIRNKLAGYLVGAVNPKITGPIMIPKKEKRKFSRRSRRR